MKIRFITLLIIAFFIILNSIGQDLYWTGNAGDEDWFNITNWSPEQVPTLANDVYFENPPPGESIDLADGAAECNNFYVNGTGYTFEMDDDGILEISNDFALAVGNTFENHGTIDIGHDANCSGYIDNYKKGNLLVNNLLTIGASGQIDNRGNGPNYAEINAYDMDNYGLINNEDFSEIMVVNQFKNYNDFNTFNKAYTEAGDLFYNQGDVTIEKMSDLKVIATLENYGTIIFEDKSTFDGDNNVLVQNYGDFNVLDKSEVFNVFEIENSGIIFNESSIETQDLTQFDGAVFTNEDVVNIIFSCENDGFIDNYASFTIGDTFDNTMNGTVNNVGCYEVIGDLTNTGLYAGSLLNHASISGTGTYTYNRDTGGTGATAAFNGWHYISTPVGGMSCHEIFDYYINDWDETNNTWYNYSPSGSPCVAGPDNPFDLMKGYSIKRELNYTCNAVNPATGAVVEFAGPASQVHTGNQSIMVTGTNFQPGDPDNMNNWNLVGNPYPSAIDAGAIAFPSQIDNAIYYYNDATLSYESFVGGVGQPFIPVAQGFFVHVNTAGTWNFAIDNTVRVCEGSDNWYKNEIANLLQIEVKHESGLGDKTYIRKLETATPQFDGRWDAYKLLTNLPEVPQIYTLVNQTKYSINSMDEAKQIPLMFKPGKEGMYTITVKGTEDFDLVYLEDKELGLFHDLKNKPWYSFTSKSENQSNRFILRFEEYAEGLENEGFIVYSKNNLIYIKNQANLLGSVSVINTLGQLIYATELQAGLNRLHLDQPSGIYIVQISMPSQTINKKIYY